MFGGFWCFLKSFHTANTKPDVSIIPSALLHLLPDRCFPDQMSLHIVSHVDTLHGYTVQLRTLATPAPASSLPSGVGNRRDVSGAGLTDH